MVGNILWEIMILSQIMSHIMVRMHASLDDDTKYWLVVASSGRIRRSDVATSY